MSRNNKSNKNKNRSGVVYSTNPDYKYDDGKSNPFAALMKDQQVLKVWLDRKGGNKVVSRIAGYQGNPQTLEKLKKTIQSACGSGGSVKEYEILIQGDHRDKIIAILTKEGYLAKKAGG